MSQKAPPGQEQPLLHGTPPPYGTSNYNHHYQSQGPSPQGVAYVPHNPVIVHQLPGNIVVIRERARCRFCRALFWAIAVWLLLGAFVKSLFIYRDYGFGYGTPRWTLGPGRESPDFPIPHGVELTSCEEPLLYGRSNQTTLQIPSSDAVLLLVDGNLLHGSVRITSTSARTDSVGFFVSLSPRHNRPANTIVCAIKRRDGEHGVGVFNPRRGWRRFDDTVRYDIVVEFPEDHPIVKRFESSVINSMYEIDDLEGKIMFETLSLRGSNGGIHSKSFFAQWADIGTSNGRIEGHFNASDFLHLHTSNGKIDADIDFNQDTSKKAVLSLTTSNSQLEARLHLYNAADLESGNSNFDVTTRTSNGKLNVAFLDAPVNSTLAFRASTSNSAAEVSLHPTFEGHFILQSSLVNPDVREHQVEDPSGQGRERFVRYGNIRGRVTGDVVWGRGSDRGKGEVDIHTSNARATLNL